MERKMTLNYKKASIIKYLLERIETNIEERKSHDYHYKYVIKDGSKDGRYLIALTQDEFETIKELINNEFKY
jgi:hypothetical protein